MDYKEELRKRLPELRKIEGFPIGKEEDIIELSNPPYYTACPNPFIEEFLKENGTPYNEEADTYRREPYVGDVSEGKSHPIYNAHTYHTKVPYKAIIPFIEHYTNENDLILDTFCGTGMTGIAAQESNRKAILSDLSPIASYIAHNYNDPIRVLDFHQKATRILKELKEELSWMYETKHTDGSIASVNYIVWSDVFISPFSGNEFIFFDAAVDYESGKVSKEFPCPDTGATLTKKTCNRATVTFYDEFTGKEVTQVKQVPVLVNYTVREKNGQRVKNVKYNKRPDDFDLAIIDKVNKEQIPYWFPSDKMMLSKEDRWGDAFRAGYHLGITHVHHFFHKRNLWALAALKDKCGKDSHLNIWFTSQLVNLSRLNRYRPGVSFPYNPLSGTLYIGSQISEANIFDAYENKLKKMVRAFDTVKSKNLVYTGSATDLPISNNSIDYIFTDPPFGDNLMYSELNFIWESWLKVFTNTKEEGIINNSQSKGLVEYNKLMAESFKEYFRVLKPKRWITVVFHNSRSSVWNGIQEAITKAGFMIGQVSTLDKKQGSYKQVTAPGAVANDLVISAFKPKQRFTLSFLQEAGLNLESEFVEEFLSNVPARPIIERTEKMLYSKMVAYYIQRGYEIRYDAKSFYSLLKNNFIEEDGFWFTSDQINSYSEYKKYAKLNEIEEIKSGGLFLFVTDEKSALVWLHNFLNQPKSFSDVSVAFNQLANIQDDQVPELRNLLEENFVFEGGLYRRPKSEEEHNQITEKRQKQLLKQFESILIQAQTERKKIKEVRKEALTYGFERCYKDKRFKDILTIASKLHPSILENNGELADFVEAAEIQTEGLT